MDLLGTVVLAVLVVVPPLAVLGGLVYVLRVRRPTVDSFEARDRSDGPRVRSGPSSRFGSVVEGTIEWITSAGQHRLDDDGRDRTGTGDGGYSTRDRGGTGDDADGRGDRYDLGDDWR
jgi:hypothetical protein